MTDAAASTLDVADPNVLRELVGDLGAHLRWVGEALGVQATARGSTLRFASRDGRHVIAHRLFTELARLAASGHRIHPADVQDGLRLIEAEPGVDLGGWFRDSVLVDVRKRPIVPRTANQRAYVACLRRHEVVFGVGPAGTGKTYLAMAVAVAALKKGLVRRIVLTRPAVEAGEKLGFLPGALQEKVDPYLRPLFDALADMVERRELEGWMADGTVEVAPLAFMRGRTLRDAYVLLDEAQNTTVEQMKMFLTRLGEKGRMVITGDPTQTDLPRHVPSGMAHALRVLAGVPAVGVSRLGSEDVVRHPIVAAIVDAYAAAERADEVDRGGGSGPPRRRARTEDDGAR